MPVLFILFIKITKMFNHLPNQCRTIRNHMLQAFQKFRYGFHSTPDDIVKYVLAHFNPITFCQKVNCIFKASLFSFSLESLLSFESTRSKSHNPPNHPTVSVTFPFPQHPFSPSSLFAPCSVLIVYSFFQKSAFFFRKNEVLSLLLDFVANSKTLCISSGVFHLS